jgi:hypothetical protein
VNTQELNFNIKPGYRNNCIINGANAFKRKFIWVIAIFATRSRNVRFMPEAVEQIGLNNEAKNNTNREEINTKLMNQPETGPHQG